MTVDARDVSCYACCWSPAAPAKKGNAHDGKAEQTEADAGHWEAQLVAEQEKSSKLQEQLGALKADLSSARQQVAKLQGALEQVSICFASRKFSAASVESCISCNAGIATVEGFPVRWQHW